MLSAADATTACWVGALRLVTGVRRFRELQSSAAARLRQTCDQSPGLDVTRPMAFSTTHARAHAVVRSGGSVALANSIFLPASPGACVCTCITCGKSSHSGVLSDVRKTLNAATDYLLINVHLRRCCRQTDAAQSTSIISGKRAYVRTIKHCCRLQYHR